MDPAVIADDPEYKAALASAALLMGARGGTAAGERLKVLVGLIEAYERQHFPLDLAAPTGSKPAGARRAAKRPTRA